MTRRWWCFPMFPVGLRADVPDAESIINFAWYAPEKSSKSSRPRNRTTRGYHNASVRRPVQEIPGPRLVHWETTNLNFPLIPNIFVMNSTDQSFTALLRPFDFAEGLIRISFSSVAAFGIGLLILMLLSRRNGNVSWILATSSDAAQYHKAILC